MIDGLSSESGMELVVQIFQTPECPLIDDTALPDFPIMHTSHHIIGFGLLPSLELAFPASSLFFEAAFPFG
jgi:hypothetical protein